MGTDTDRNLFGGFVAVAGAWLVLAAASGVGVAIWRLLT